jgi:hypothetical protein
VIGLLSSSPFFFTNIASSFLAAFLWGKQEGVWKDLQTWLCTIFFLKLELKQFSTLKIL